MNGTLLPARLTRCRSCNTEVGWVRLPGERWRTVDTEPKPWAPYALLRDGVRAVDLTAPYVPVGERWRVDTPRFVPHHLTCVAPGMRKAG